MKETYPVTYNGNLAGNVAVSREGLYYRFQCRVKLPKDCICRLQLWNGDSCTDLGVCVPVNDYFELDKRIPAKSLKEECFIFKLNSNQTNERFIPVREDQAVDFIKEIHLAKFAVRGGTAGLLFP